jgi:hypothetical protein
VATAEAAATVEAAALVATADTVAGMAEDLVALAAAMAAATAVDTDPFIYRTTSARCYNRRSNETRLRAGPSLLIPIRL